METLVFEAVLLRQSRGYSALCLDVDVATQAPTRRLAKRRLAEAVQGYVETALASNLPVLRPVPASENPLVQTPQDVAERFALRVNLSVNVHA